MTCSGSFAMLERMSTASSDYTESGAYRTSLHSAPRLRTVKSQQHVVIAMPLNWKDDATHKRRSMPAASSAGVKAEWL
ncbi:hypothetical protein PINS_up009618 [Pythium insidiosum]|nr:hypothetical protein PINS_up009618 [Pythium insidiosum]